MVKLTEMEIVLTHLYPIEMNIYGDNGNVLAIKKRLEWRGVRCRIEHVEIGDAVPNDTDILIGGGGQDIGQVKVADDLISKQSSIKRLHDQGCVALVVCGLYQLFGEYFKPLKQKQLKGIGIFDAYTIGKTDRLIGNSVVLSEWGELVGYENHSGNTYLRDGQKALGSVMSGEGNNDEDRSEGAVSNNFFGTYLHGPLLPKNPEFCDELIVRALSNKYGKISLKDLNDTIEHEAAEIAKGRPR